MSTTAHSSTASNSGARLQQITRVAVAVDGYPEGRDATRLGAKLAGITAAQPILVMVVSAPSAAPRWVGQEGLYDLAQATLEQVRDALLPDARVIVKHDDSVARGLERIVAQEHRDLLVVGSSRHAAEGHVRIGKHTHQLLGHAGCALAIAPRGLHHKGVLTLQRIGVRYDAGPEAEAALTVGGSLARATGAELHVHAVVDERGVRPIDWSTMKGGPAPSERDSYVRADVGLLRERTGEAAHAVDPHAEVEVHRGRPADALLEMSTRVDLMVIGSRRWGAVARLLLGTTGEALLHDAQCPVLVVPRSRSGPSGN
jgi:nucleotide-binding universal stress UspA family protein